VQEVFIELRLFDGARIIALNEFLECHSMLLGIKFQDMVMWLGSVSGGIPRPSGRYRETSDRVISWLGHPYAMIPLSPPKWTYRGILLRLVHYKSHNKLAMPCR